MTVTFTVPGEPQGKQRPRHMKNGHTYTPDETRQYEKLVREAYILQSGLSFGKAAIVVNILAFFRIPKSFTRKQRELIRTGELFPTVKPDGDNIEKIVWDALSGTAYFDDKQIVDHHCRKLYAYGDERSVGLIVTVSDEVKYYEGQT